MAEITSTQSKHFLSDKVEHFTESVIREMTRQAMQHGAVNLAQGFPDFPAPEEIKRAAQQAISDDVNQYAITWGAKNFRDAITAKWLERTGISVDPEREITVCCGSTETREYVEIVSRNAEIYRKLYGEQNESSGKASASRGGN